MHRVPKVRRVRRVRRVRLVSPTRVFARVGSDGTVGQQRGVVSVSGLDGGPRSTGVYQVNFDRDVTNCVPTVNRADVELPRDANFSVRQPEPNAMLVTIYNDAGTAFDVAFYIVVNC